MKNHKGFPICIALLLMLVLAACGVQPKPDTNLVLPDNFRQAEVLLPGHDKPQNVTYEIVDDYAIFEGDIILGNVDKAGQLMQSGLEPQGSAIKGRNFRWTEGIIPFQISGNWGANDAAVRSQITSAINHWNTTTNVHLVARTTQTAFVNFVAGTGCSSFVGRQGTAQPITLATNCGTPAIIHEIGHAVGLWHEQSRTDRDSFVSIVLANIQAGKEGNFVKHVTDGMNLGGYDYRSIMHYPCNAFSSNGQNTIQLINPPLGVSCTTVGRGTALSSGDKSAVRKMYTPVVVRSSTGVNFNANQAWTDIVYFGTRGTFFADVTGDGKADAIVVNNNKVTVRRSTGSGLNGNESWTNEPYFGTRGTFFADVTGDGKADAIVVNDNGIVVRRSTGSNFSSNESWANEPYFGTRGTFFADVSGDGKADAIVVNDNGVVVRRSNLTGTSFNGNNESWTQGVAFFGTRGTFFADVSGDGKADVIVVNDNGIVVRPSNGSSFGLNQGWTTNPYFGTRGTFFADVTGDGWADAIAVNDDSVTVRRATASCVLIICTNFRFDSNESWTANPYFGSVGTFFADVTGEGRADAIVINQ